MNATTRRNEHGKVIGVVGIGQDITGEEIIMQNITIRMNPWYLKKHTLSCDTFIDSGRIAQGRLITLLLASYIVFVQH